jgi:hypothetical protein
MSEPHKSNQRRLPVIWQECVWCPELCACQANSMPPEHCQIRQLGFVAACPKPGPRPVKINKRSN